MAKKKTLKKAVTQKSKIKKAVKKPLKKPAQKAAAKPVKKTAQKPAKMPLKKSSSKALDLSKIISPLDDRLIVHLQTQEKITSGGLIIPDTAQMSGNQKGQVVAVGRGHRNKFGKIRPMEVEVGDQILVAEYSGDSIEILGHQVKILREVDVLGIIE